MEMQSLQKLTKQGADSKCSERATLGEELLASPGVATSWPELSEGAWQERGQFCQLEVQLWFAQKND